MSDEAPVSEHDPAAADRWPMLALCALLVATGALAWGFTLRPALAVDTAPLESLPLAFGEWKGEDIALEDDVTEMLGADLNLQRIYERAPDEWVWLYVGYYGTESGGHTPHTPWVCYPAAGWSLEPTDAAPRVRRELGVNEVAVEMEGDRRLVHFWYRSHRATGMVSTFGWNVDRMLGRLLDGRADGALVRISTPIDDATGGIERARQRLRGFGADIEARLGDHWPDERVASGPAARG